jgi:hypothetical protein
MMSIPAGVVSMGIISLSLNLKPYPPISLSSQTSSVGDMCSQVVLPKGSAPRLPTVHRPKANLCSGFVEYSDLEAT